MNILDDLLIEKDYSSNKNLKSEDDLPEESLTNFGFNANESENVESKEIGNEEFILHNSDDLLERIYSNLYENLFENVESKEIENIEFKHHSYDNSLLESIYSNLLSSPSEQNSLTENKINEVRSRKLDDKLTQEFISLLREEDFEFGFKTRSEQLISEQLQINALATRNWLNEIFVKYYADEIIIIGILRIIGRFDPKQIFPQGQTMALAALSHKNDEIKELGIRAFEHWCSYESLNILKNLELEKEWLKEYVDEVITDFEEQLCHI